MTRRTHWFLLPMLAIACADPAPPAAEMAADALAPAATDPISIAMSAAPSAVSSGARIMQFDSTGALQELRAGTNGWMCLPDDDPNAPGNAPMCVDPAWQQWLEAYMAQQPPQISGVGISYMLQGGPFASNTDPFATAPPAGTDWQYDGPHLMVIVPDPSQLDTYPTDPKNGGPYVMWKGTPYAHLMVPAGAAPPMR